MLDGPVADEAGPRRAQGDQFVGVDRKVGGGLWWVRSAVLDKVPRHPIVFAAGKVFDRLTVEVPVQLHTTFARGSDQSNGDPRLKRLRYNGGFAIAGKAL